MGEKVMSDGVRQFDPLDGLTAAVEGLDVLFAEVDALRPRLAFQLQRVASEIDKAREARDRLQIFDEAEAAAILQLKEDHLASMRRNHNLPHAAFGPKIRYTKAHLDQIVAFFDSRNAGRKAA